MSKIGLTKGVASAVLDGLLDGEMVALSAHDHGLLCPIGCGK
jgi:hypothetical protein